MKSKLTPSLLLLLFFSLTGGAWAKSLTLSWDASPSVVTGYKIYYNSGSSTEPMDGTGAAEGASPIDVGNLLTFTVTGLPDDQDHYFVVTAYDDAGNESDFSNLAHSPAAPVNQAPQLAAIGNKSTTEGANRSFTLSASDADGDTLTFSAESLPSGASLNSSSGAFSWTPTYDQAGTYSITFKVSDGSLEDSETISFSVADVNRAPQLAAIGTQSVDEGQELKLTLSGSDPDGDTLSFSASGLPTGASFDPSTRVFAWTPPFDGTENTRIYSVEFAVSDGTA